MLKNVQFSTRSGKKLLSVPVGKPVSSNPYYIPGLEGLDPVKATINTVGLPTSDGGVFRGSKVDGRNITLAMVIRSMVGSNAATLRQNVYDLLAPQDEVILTLEQTPQGDRPSFVQIAGIIESIESPIFSRSTALQFSVICPLPYFEELASTKVSGVMGDILTLEKTGSAPTGFLFESTLEGPLSQIAIKNSSGEVFRVADEFLAGDRIRVSTVPGNKFITRVRKGYATNILDKIGAGTISMTVGPKNPQIIVNEGIKPVSPYTITYTPKYIGL